MMQLENFKFSEIDTIFVDFAHIEKTDVNLATAVREQYYRYEYEKIFYALSVILTHRLVFFLIFVVQFTTLFANTFLKVFTSMNLV